MRYNQTLKCSKQKLNQKRNYVFDVNLTLRLDRFRQGICQVKPKP